MDCFSPFPFPLCFPVVEQAQLVASHGPVPEALVGGKVLLCTGRAELCFFLFPLFITNDQGRGEILCLRAVAFIHWKKTQQVKTWGSLATGESREESTDQHWVTELLNACREVRASVVLSCQWPQPEE